MNCFKPTLLFLALFIFIEHDTHGQGCVAVRGISSCGGGMGGSTFPRKGEFYLQTGVRYFKSYRHFRGDSEEEERVANGTEVINKSYFFDLYLSYGISDRLFVNAVVPFVNHHRTSMYEHGGNPPGGLGERHATTSRGISDVRAGFGFWLFKPTHEEFNYSVGLGIKLPTGNYNYQDLFYNQGPTRSEDRMAVVDQSIQPGDGGTGVTFDLQGYHLFGEHFGFNTNVYYLSNFQESNGVKTRNGTSVFSCPDQFAVRLGPVYRTKSGMNVVLAARADGVPSQDLIGSSRGYRRPGYVVAAEPGLGWNKNKISLFASIPISLYRNRTQSYEDRERTFKTGVYAHGDAAFADYLLNFSFSYRFGKSGHPKMD